MLSGCSAQRVSLRVECMMRSAEDTATANVDNKYHRRKRHVKVAVQMRRCRRIAITSMLHEQQQSHLTATIGLIQVRWTSYMTL